MKTLSMDFPERGDYVESDTMCFLPHRSNEINIHLTRTNTIDKEFKLW